MTETIAKFNLNTLQTEIIPANRQPAFIVNIDSPNMFLTHGFYVDDNELYAPIWKTDVPKQGREFVQRYTYQPSSNSYALTAQLPWQFPEERLMQGKMFGYFWGSWIKKQGALYHSEGNFIFKTGETAPVFAWTKSALAERRLMHFYFVDDRILLHSFDKDSKTIHLDLYTTDGEKIGTKAFDVEQHTVTYHNNNIFTLSLKDETYYLDTYSMDVLELQ